MIPELGHFSLILALALAGLLAVVPLAGVQTGREVWMRSAGSLAAGLFTFLALSFVCLAWSFLTTTSPSPTWHRTRTAALPCPLQVLERRLGRARRLVPALDAGHGRLDARRCRCSAARCPSTSSRACWRSWVRSAVGFPVIPAVRLESLRAAAADRAAERRGPQSAAPGHRPHRPSAHALRGLYRLRRRLRLRHRRLLWSGRLDAAWARWSRPWTNVAWAFLSHRHRARQLVGLLRARLGGLVVLGCRGERLLHALARGYGPDPLAGVPRRSVACSGSGRSSSPSVPSACRCSGRSSCAPAS
jgi:cytochrome c-type biogenesis protein CcmF